MMKRKILAVTIPVVGCITVVGSGFSAWYFSTTTGNATDGSGFGVNINVTEEVKDTSSTLEIVNSNANTDTDPDPDTDNSLVNTHLILDQGGVSNKEDATKGIMFAKYADDESVVNETVDRTVNYTFDLVFTGDTSLTLNKIYDAKMEVAVSVKFDLGQNLSQYIKPVTGAGLEVTYSVVGEPSTATKKESFTNSGTGTVYTSEIVFEAADLAKMSNSPIKNYTWNFKLDLSTDGLANKLFQYVDKETKPQNSGALSTMSGLINGTALKFETSASIREKKTSN